MIPGRLAPKSALKKQVSDSFKDRRCFTAPPYGYSSHRACNSPAEDMARAPQPAVQARAGKRASPDRQPAQAAASEGPRDARFPLRIRGGAVVSAPAAVNVHQTVTQAVVHGLELLSGERR